MRPFPFVLVLLLAISSSQARTQSPTPAPQTARQALLEMFVGKNSDAFTKHLPEAARPALMRKGETPETSLLLKISMAAHQLTAQGGQIETFDVGPVLLVSDKGRGQGEGQERVEVMIEHDYLTGEQDEIEISIHASSNGEPQFLPVIPRLIFFMIQEKETWRLSEVTLSLHVPLTDPDYLKGVRKMADGENENMASIRIGVIANGETTFASKHPDRGYTCNLAELSEMSGETDTPMLMQKAPSPDPAFSESDGYHFSLSGCDGSPASKFRLIAVPADTEAGMKVFCADESGTVRFERGGKGASCLSRGQALDRPGAAVAAGID